MKDKKNRQATHLAAMVQTDQGGPGSATSSRLCIVYQKLGAMSSIALRRVRLVGRLSPSTPWLKHCNVTIIIGRQLKNIARRALQEDTQVVQRDEVNHLLLARDHAADGAFCEPCFLRQLTNCEGLAMIRSPVQHGLLDVILNSHITPFSFLLTLLYSIFASLSSLPTLKYCK